MVTVVILGFGNVGSHLHQICEATQGIEVLQVYARNTPIDIVKPVMFTNNLKGIVSHADLYIAAVPDDTIYKITSQLSFTDKLVVHTSGGASIESISETNRRGVFYPLQTFSKNKEVDFKNIPICIEAENEEDLSLLLTMGRLISEKVSHISSKEREKLHVAAVFVNNFVNELYHISEDILKDQHLDFSLLTPLIKETAQKLESLSPALAQTGPAIRGDKKTIQRHQELLTKPQQEVYQLLTKSIQKRNKSQDE
jgi:predicted short-subunit dehydrogenase-like oxidoreductase (DUF2520 family)